MDDPYSCGNSRLGGSFPLACYVSEKTVARWTVFVEDRVAPVAVEADCGRRDKHVWRRRQFCQPFAQHAGSVDAAVKNTPLVGLSPTSGSYVFAGQVNDGIHAI
jgi:hypothetical protein